MNLPLNPLESNGAYPKEPSSDVDIKGLSLRLLRNWYFILIGTVIGFFIARSIIRYSVREFSVSSSVLIKDSGQRGGGEINSVNDLFGFSRVNNLLNEIKILKSRSLMMDVVEGLGLETSYFELGSILEKELYQASPVRIDSLIFQYDQHPIQFKIKILDDYQFELIDVEDSETYQFGRPFALGYDSLNIRRNLDFEGKDRTVKIQILPNTYAAQELIKNLTVNQESDLSSVLTLSLVNQTPQKATDVLNQLVYAYNRDAVDDRNQLNTKTLEFLTQRLAILTSELARVESNVASFKQQNEIPTEAGASVSLIMAEITQYENQLVQLEIKRNILISVEELLNKDDSDFELIPANLLLDETGSLSGQISAYNALVLKRNRYGRSASENNPLLQSVDQELNSLKANLYQSIVAAKKDIQLTVDKNLLTLNSLKSRVNTVPQLEKELVEIKRQQNIKEGLYLFLLQKKEEIALSSASIPTKAKIIDPAIVEEAFQVAPKPIRIYALGTMLGMLIPTCLITLLFFLDDKVYSEEDISDLTQIPFVGVIGKDKSGKTLIIEEQSNSAVAEMFRMIRTNLNYFARTKNAQTIMITSLLAGEGKTFLAINLGMSMALSKKKTVILGFDLRKPRLLQNLTGRPDHGVLGISSFLTGSVPVEDIIYQTELSSDLFIIPSGLIPPNPSELLQRDLAIDLFDFLRDKFDVIIIDTAPIGLVTDSIILGEKAEIDVTLVSVRHGKTTKKGVQYLEKERKNAKLIYPAIVLNGFPLKKIKRYGGYGYGSYYGSYTYEGTPNKKGIRKIIRNVVNR